MPAGSQNKQRALPNGNLEHRWVPIVELSQHLDLRNLLQPHPAMFPEMDFGEVAEPGVGERGKERMLEIDLAQHRVSGPGSLSHQQALDPAKLGDGLCS